MGQEVVNVSLQLQPVMYLSLGHYLLGKTDIPTEIQIHYSLYTQKYVSH